MACEVSAGKKRIAVQFIVGELGPLVSALNGNKGCGIRGWGHVVVEVVSVVGVAGWWWKWKVAGIVGVVAWEAKGCCAYWLNVWWWAGGLPCGTGSSPVWVGYFGD